MPRPVANSRCWPKRVKVLSRIIDACGGAPSFQLLMLEHPESLAKTSAQAISNIKFDKIVVWEGGGNGTGVNNTAQFPQEWPERCRP